MWVETDADEAAERASVQESRDSARLTGCSSARGTGVLHQCKMAQRGVQRCEMHGVLQQLKGQRGSTCQRQRELQHQRVFLAQQRGQLGDFIVSRVVGATTLRRSVACRTFQRFRIGFELNVFLVEREC